MYAPKLQQYIINTKNQIEDIEQKIKNIDTFETANIKLQIEKLKNQDIAKIKEKITFLQTVQIPSLKAKILFYRNNLQKYTKAIENLYKNNKNSNTAVATIAAIQMVNYQNLILDAQNKIEDLNVKIRKINNEIIPNLKREIKNIKQEKIRKLEQKLLVDIPQTKIKLKQKIEQLKFNISPQNVQNYKVVGEYIAHDYPVKPKKKLILVVAFITGLILSVFLVFFIEFIKSFKEEEYSN